VTRARAALAGAAAALAWGLLEPVDQRIFRYRYSDVAILGKAVSRGRGWRPAGLAMHTANGAMFGLAWRGLSRRRRVSPTAFALVEHVALFPLGALVDRHHPARGTREVPRIFTWRAFVQATWRHLLFGWLLGKLAGAGAPAQPAAPGVRAAAAAEATRPRGPSPSPRA
jgi:hypothetical protein